jgi:hypothetical protein
LSICYPKAIPGGETAEVAWMRLIVQAHRRDLTISDYVAMLLDRHVPDHRVVRSDPSIASVEPGDDQDAAERREWKRPGPSELEAWPRSRRP